MRRRALTLTVLALFALVGAACNDDDSMVDDDTTSETLAPPTSQEDLGEQGVDPGTEITGCEPYATISAIFADRESIATGGAGGQEAANAVFAQAVGQLRELTVGGDPGLQSALDVLEGVRFTVSDQATGPAPEEVDAAKATLDGVYGDTCAG